MALILITPPDVEPVTLAEAKTALRVDGTVDDLLISTYIAVARDYVERTARPKLALITQTWRFIADEWPDGDTVELRPYPLQVVGSIKYTDDSGVERTFSSSNYLVDTASEPGRIRLKGTASWPSTTLRDLNGLAIEFDAGFGDAGSDVPEMLRQAILLLVAHWYENREPILTTGAMPMQIALSVAALMSPWRREQS